MGLMRVNLELPDGHPCSTKKAARRSCGQLENITLALFTSHWDDPHPTMPLERKPSLATMKLRSRGGRTDQNAGGGHAVYSRLVLPSFVVDVLNLPN